MNLKRRLAALETESSGPLVVIRVCHEDRHKPVVGYRVVATGDVLLHADGETQESLEDRASAAAVAASNCRGLVVIERLVDFEFDHHS